MIRQRSLSNDGPQTLKWFTDRWRDPRGTATTATASALVTWLTKGNERGGPCANP